MKHVLQVNLTIDILPTSVLAGAGLEGLTFEEQTRRADEIRAAVCRELHVRVNDRACDCLAAS